MLVLVAEEYWKRLGMTEVLEGMRIEQEGDQVGKGSGIWAIDSADE